MVLCPVDFPAEVHSTTSFPLRNGKFLRLGEPWSRFAISITCFTRPEAMGWHAKSQFLVNDLPFLGKERFPEIFPELNLDLCDI